MLTRELRQTIKELHQRHKSNREITKLLKVSRNTVTEILKQGVEVPAPARSSQGTEIAPILREIFMRCSGNAVRVQEILKEEYNLDIAYSTLTRCIQAGELREPVRRVGEYRFEPGQEMQHDTSPHWVMLGEKKVKTQCASLIMGYSRKLFAQYYPCFTRFEAKTFLKAGIEFMTGSCKRCIIDNTSVVLCAGSGCDAVISPEMLTFSRMYGFEFVAHRIKNCDRKGKIERPFHYIENNFLSGRTFKDWDDLNRQAKAWCLMANQKAKRILDMNPDAAFIQEKPYLIPLPEVLPPIYEHYKRIVDCYGFVNLDTNRYSVPEKLIGKAVDVYKYPEELSISYNRRKIAVHPRLPGKRYAFSRLPGHHCYNKRLADKVANDMESALRGHHEILDQYINELKKRVKGSGNRQLNRLLNLKRTYPAEAFVYALKQAHHYGLYDLYGLEDLIIKSVAGNYFNLGEE